jgi:hypothetical protein
VTFHNPIPAKSSGGKAGEATNNRGSIVGGDQFECKPNTVNPTTNPHLQIIPFTPNHQADARNLILQCLCEHWGWIDEEINTDLVDIA